jgi:phosphatidylglycerol---prolipoprotein diacylglyceryl transferase
VNLAITWNVSPELIEGYKTPNLYGLLFVSGLIIGYLVIKKMFKKENISDDILDKLVMYMVLATIIGARLGHILFYGDHFDYTDDQGVFHEGYFSHPLSIFKVWEGGLASHGGAIAIVIALWIFTKKVSKMPYLWILDRIVAPTAIAACFIRLGNLVNSEIVGDPTAVPWAFSFPNYYNEVTRQLDATPRHPTQLYEALCYFLIFGVLMFLFWKKQAWKKAGQLFGIFLVLVFTARFFIEFVKLGQTSRDEILWINTGQMLSIPFMIVGMLVWWKSIRRETSL